MFSGFFEESRDLLVAEVIEPGVALARVIARALVIELDKATGVRGERRGVSPPCRASTARRPCLLLLSRGGLTPRMMFLSGRELTAMYQPCDQAGEQKTEAR